jgi:acetolactate synthase-1/3 small subunit
MAPKQAQNNKTVTDAMAGAGECYKKHAISLLVSNKPGVLIRIALVFAKRGYNIESLVVSPAREAAYSRMIITASGETKTLEQILKQLNKLVDVISAKDHTGEVVIERELGLIKVRGTAQQRTEILQIAHAFECKVVDLTDNTILLQLTGESYLLDSLEKMMNNYEVIEFIRTGKVIVSRGDEIT